MCTLIFFRCVAECDITVTHSVKCMDWLHRWYNHAAHLVSSSTALAFLTTSEKRKSISPSAIQVRNGWKTTGTEGKLDTISQLKKRVKEVLHTGCNRRNVQDFGRVFLRSNYTDITQNTYIQSWTVTEIMAGEVWKFDSCYSLIDYQIHIENGRNMWFL